jgi:hypothetical protein
MAPFKFRAENHGITDLTTPPNILMRQAHLAVYLEHRALSFATNALWSGRRGTSKHLILLAHGDILILMIHHGQFHSANLFDTDEHIKGIRSLVIC